VVKAIVMAMAKAVVKAMVMAGSKGRGTRLYNTHITERTFPYITGRMFCRIRFNFFHGGQSDH